MTKKVEMETKVAIATGVGRMGNIIERGETFTAPKGLKGSWFVSQGDSKAKAEEGADALTDRVGGLLELKPADLIDRLPTLESDLINHLIGAEQAGKARKSVLAKLADELQNRVGQLGGPDPAAKDPHEKDPITADGTGAADADTGVYE
jgi:hypothetical protein